MILSYFFFFYYFACKKISAFPALYVATHTPWERRYGGEAAWLKCEVSISSAD
jgi:hypothetical protein